MADTTLRCGFCPHGDHWANHPEADHREACPVAGCYCCPAYNCLGHPGDKPTPRAATEPLDPRPWRLTRTGVQYEGNPR